MDNSQLQLIVSAEIYRCFINCGNNLSYFTVALRINEKISENSSKKKPFNILLVEFNQKLTLKVSQQQLKSASKCEILLFKHKANDIGKLLAIAEVNIQNMNKNEKQKFKLKNNLDKCALIELKISYFQNKSQKLQNKQEWHLQNFNWKKKLQNQIPEKDKNNIIKKSSNHQNVIVLQNLNQQIGQEDILAISPTKTSSLSNKSSYFGLIQKKMSIISQNNHDYSNKTLKDKRESQNDQDDSLSSLNFNQQNIVQNLQSPDFYYSMKYSLKNKKQDFICKNSYPNPTQKHNSKLYTKDEVEFAKSKSKQDDYKTNSNNQKFNLGRLKTNDVNQNELQRKQTNKFQFSKAVNIKINQVSQIKNSFKRLSICIQVFQHSIKSTEKKKLYYQRQTNTQNKKYLEKCSECINEEIQKLKNQIQETQLAFTSTNQQQMQINFGFKNKQIEKQNLTSSTILNNFNFFDKINDQHQNYFKNDEETQLYIRKINSEQNYFFNNSPQKQPKSMGFKCVETVCLRIRPPSILNKKNKQINSQKFSIQIKNQQNIKTMNNCQNKSDFFGTAINVIPQLNQSLLNQSVLIDQQQSYFLGPQKNQNALAFLFPGGKKNQNEQNPSVNFRTTSSLLINEAQSSKSSQYEESQQFIQLQELQNSQNKHQNSLKHSARKDILVRQDEKQKKNCFELYQANDLLSKTNEFLSGRKNLLQNQLKQFFNQCSENHVSKTDFKQLQIKFNQINIKLKFNEQKLKILEIQHGQAKKKEAKLNEEKQVLIKQNLTISKNLSNAKKLLSLLEEQNYQNQQNQNPLKTQLTKNSRNQQLEIQYKELLPNSNAPLRKTSSMIFDEGIRVSDKGQDLWKSKSQRKISVQYKSADNSIINDISQIKEKTIFKKERSNENQIQIKQKQRIKQKSQFISLFNSKKFSQLNLNRNQDRLKSQKQEQSNYFQYLLNGTSNKNNKRTNSLSEFEMSRKKSSLSLSKSNVNSKGNNLQRVNSQGKFISSAKKQYFAKPISHPVKINLYQQSSLSKNYIKFQIQDLLVSTKS